MNSTDEQKYSFLDIITSLNKDHRAEKIELTSDFSGEQKIQYHTEDMVKISKDNKDFYVSEKRWNDYETFIKKLETRTQEFKKQEIKDFWKEFEQAEAKDKNLFSWVNEKKLDGAKEEILSNKDKSGSRCFQDLILYKEPLVVNDLSIFNQLDKELPNFKDVTAFYRGAFALNQSRPKDKYQAPKVILLLGNPGIGKTHYAKKLANILGTSYFFLDSSSITSNWVLSGNNATWRGADAGLIFKQVAKSKTISPIILLDEIDKISSGHEYSPFSTFHQMFEKENAREFFDEFVGIHFDASKIIYILTANDPSNIAPSLLSRMSVFNIENPSKDDMRSIIQTIYSSIRDESTMFEPILDVAEVNKLTSFSPREVSQVISQNMHLYSSSIIVNGDSNKPKFTIYPNVFQKNKIGF